MNNAILQKNLHLFSKRFEQLHKGLIAIPIPSTPPKGIELCVAKNNEQTALFEKSYMHSSYNPSSESKKIIQSTELSKADSIVFYGVGLGYAAIECALQHPSKTIIIIEPNPEYILFAFSILDWTSVLNHSSLVFLIEAPQQTVITVIEQYGLKECFFVVQKTIMQHAINYFANIQTLIERNKDKQAVNMKTLEKFSTLWLSNMCKNISIISKLEGIQKYENKANDIPACILAAGPTLDTILPHLHEIKKRCILICVDTALRACLSVGVQPHFIILVDPQYWNARHIDGLSAPESILITESAAYPSAFRFNCKEILLCSSLFPLGKYIENFSGKKGTLAAGGSVATSAWDFARFIGCTQIYMAGLDLSFPDKKTHTKGSTFEERSHAESKRLSPTETALAQVLYNVHTEKSFDYLEREVITDARMKLYAWWFESKCSAYSNIQTFSLSNKSLSIPGIKVSNIQRVLNLPLAQIEIDDFKKTQSNNQAIISTTEIIEALLNDFTSLETAINKGISLCNKHCKSDREYESILASLTKVDSEISNSSAKDIVSLVFPTDEKLQSIIQEKLPIIPPPPPKGTYALAAQYNIDKAKILYELIKKSIDFNIHYLRKNA